MESKVEYQVLAPGSVAWFILAALTADRQGKEHTRDLALAEAQRIVAERRLVKQPAPSGGRALAYDVAHECNGVRLAELERMISSLHEHQVLDARRVEVLENRLDRVITFAASDQAHKDLAKQVDALEYTVRNLQRLAQNVHGPEAGL